MEIRLRSYFGNLDRLKHEIDRSEKVNNLTKIAKQGISELKESRSQTERAIKAGEYWKIRAIAAETYIDLSPCDPDINKGQMDAYEHWTYIKNIGPNKYP